MDTRLVNKDLPFLPNEIFYYHIFPYLNKQSWLNLRKTNTAFNQLVTHYLFEYLPLPKSIDKLFHEGNIHIETRLLLRYLRQPEYAINNRVNAFIYAAANNGVKLAVSPERKALINPVLAAEPYRYFNTAHLSRPFFNGLTKLESKQLVEKLFAEIATDSTKLQTIMTIMQLSPPYLTAQIIESSWKYWNDLPNASLRADILILFMRIVPRYTQEQNVILIDRLLEHIYSFANEHSFDKVTYTSYGVESAMLSVIPLAMETLTQVQVENYLTDTLKRLEIKKTEVKFFAIKVLGPLVACLDRPNKKVNFTSIQKKALLTVLLNELKVGGEVVVNAVVCMMERMASQLNTEQANYLFFEVRACYPLSYFKEHLLQILKAVASKLGSVATAAALDFFLMELDKYPSAWTLFGSNNQGHRDLHPSIKLALNLLISLRPALVACDLTAKQLELIYQYTLTKLKSDSNEIYLFGLKMASQFAGKFTPEQNQKTLRELTLKLHSPNSSIVQTTCFTLPYIFQSIGKLKPAIPVLTDKIVPLLFLSYFQNDMFMVIAPELTPAYVQLILDFIQSNLAIEKGEGTRARALILIGLLGSRFNREQQNFIFETLIMQRLASDEIILREQALDIIDCMKGYFTIKHMDILWAWIVSSINGDDSVRQDLALRVVSYMANRLHAKHVESTVNLIHSFLEKSQLSTALNLRALTVLLELSSMLNEDQCAKILPAILLKFDLNVDCIHYAAFRLLHKLVGRLSEEQCTKTIDKALSKLMDVKQYDLETLYRLITHMIVNDKCDARQLQKDELKTNVYANVLQCFAIWYEQVKQMALLEGVSSELVVKHGLFAEQKKVVDTKKTVSDSVKNTCKNFV